MKSDSTLMASGGFSISIKSSQINEKYLLGLLNSKLLFYLLYNQSNKFRGGYITCTKQYFENLPICKQNNHRITELVDEIIIYKEMSPESDTSALEVEIDQMVYELYGLTEEEIAIVENSIKS